MGKAKMRRLAARERRRASLAAQGQQQAEQSAQVKRGRGRPKKEDSKQADNQTVEAEE